MNSWWTLITGYAEDLAAAAWAKTACAFLFTACLRFFGLDHSPIEALMTLMVCDYILGFAHAWREKNIDVGKLRRGLGKFIGYAMALNIAWLADKGMNIPLDAAYSLRNLLCAYLAAHEAFSALTHLGAFGVPIPVWLMDRLRSYRKSIEHPKRRRSDRNNTGQDHEC